MTSNPRWRHRKSPPVGTREEWRRLGLADKVQVVTQIVTAAAIVPTLIFAAMAWFVTNQAREEQRAFFLAEKAPDAAVSDFQTTPDSPGAIRYLQFKLTNIGASEIEGLTVQFFLTAGNADGLGDKFEYPLSIRLPAKREYILDLAPLAAIEHALERPFQSAKAVTLGMLGPARQEAKVEELGVLHVIINGPQGHQAKQVFVILVPARSS